MQSDKPSPTGRRQAIGAAALIASGLAATARTGAAQGVSSPHGPQAGGDSGVYAPGDGALQPNVTPALSAFIGGAATASWPDDIAELARRHILDTLASIIACQPLPPAVLSRNYALSHAAAAAGQGATILGTRQRAMTSEAAFAGAMAGHSAEINDFSPSAFVQPGPSIVSTSLALAEEHDASGKRVLAAVIAGYEIGCRLPKALGLRNLRRAGIANHCIGSLFGSATAGRRDARPARIPSAFSAHILQRTSKRFVAMAARYRSHREGFRLRGRRGPQRHSHGADGRFRLHRRTRQSGPPPRLAGQRHVPWAGFLTSTALI